MKLAVLGLASVAMCCALWASMPHISSSRHVRAMEDSILTTGQTNEKQSFGMPNPAQKLPGRSFENGDKICRPLTQRPDYLTPSCSTYKLSTRYVANCTNDVTKWVSPLLVTSTGRSGTTFMAAKLTRSGYRFEHDNKVPWPTETGAVNWVAAFMDYRQNSYTTYPGFCKSFEGVRFKKVLLQSRDPVRSIASRTTGSACDKYMEFWMARKTGSDQPLTDVTSTQCNLGNKGPATQEFALAHFVSWHEFLYQVADFAYRLEDHDVEVIAKMGGLPPPKREPLQPPGNSTNHRPHSDMSWESLYKLNVEATLRAGRLALLYGYCLPLWLETKVQQAWFTLDLWTPTEDFLPNVVRDGIKEKEAAVARGEVELKGP